MTFWTFVLYLLALFCFAFAAAGIGTRRMNLVALGLCFFLTVHVIKAANGL